jgi:hypothetical protein
MILGTAPARLKPCIIWLLTLTINTATPTLRSQQMQGHLCSALILSNRTFLNRMHNISQLVQHENLRSWRAEPSAERYFTF